AFPDDNSRRTRAGWHGVSGRLFVSTTKITVVPFRVTPLARVTFPSPRISSGFRDGGTGGHPVCLFNRRPQCRGLRCHPLVPLHAPVASSHAGLRLVRCRLACTSPELELGGI